MPLKENIKKDRKSSNGVTSNSKTEKKKNSTTDCLQLLNRESLQTAWASIESDSDGTITNLNYNWAKTLGYKREERVGNHHRMFCHACFVKTSSYKKFWKSLINEAVQSGEFRRLINGREALGDLPIYHNSAKY